MEVPLDTPLTQIEQTLDPFPTYAGLRQNQPVFFGIMAVVIALGAGLLVGMIFKKGGHH